MKRLLIATLAIVLILTGIYIATPTLPLLKTKERAVPFTEEYKPNYDDDKNYSNFVGRLYVEELNIDVALYRSNKQYVVDRDDSAAYFDLSYARRHMLIADHNTEAFAPLNTAVVGMIAKIVKDDGTTIYYECVDVFKGHNTGKGISDWNGKSVVKKADLLMYTCFDGWRNVIVALWNEIPNPIDETQKSLDNYITSVNDLINEMLIETE
jgi:hypothetical protein